MSTFKGIVKEFPNIRIDYFRRDEFHPPPLACFLSHVHSDHLLGLESLKAPFVYCSPATKEILLRLEKYPARMNFAKGILETRTQTYKHLKHLLKTIPLETPTMIELSPGLQIRVTLIDANHCIGSVMFLIEGNSKAVLYTGDVRAEPWWISSLTRNPVFIQYSCGIKTLDNIYLDTTFATVSRLYKVFPSKLAGIKELLEKIQQYPKDTIFYFQAWTFGYEDVWLALSSLLQSRIHVDEYRSRIYSSIHSINHCRESPQLSGYTLGNHFIPGCLTKDENVRIHSCERGIECPVVSMKDNIVHILPIITRDENGQEIRELGAGGGKGDLNQVQELELQDSNVIENLMELCSSIVQDHGVLERIKSLVTACHQSRIAKVHLESFIDPDETQETQGSDIKLDRVVEELEKMVQEQNLTLSHQSKPLPTTITFPYSRHSSYSELCELVAAFNPKEIFPCTVETNWTPEFSMAALFGEHCAPGATFQHDEEMYQRYRSESNSQSLCTDSYPFIQSQTTEGNASPIRPIGDIFEDLLGSSQPLNPLPALTLDISDQIIDMTSAVADHPEQLIDTGMKRKAPVQDPESDFETRPAAKRNKSGSERACNYVTGINSDFSDWESLGGLVCNQTSKIETDAQPATKNLNMPRRTCSESEDGDRDPELKRNKSIRQWAYEAATELNPECSSWEALGGLVCTRKDVSFEIRVESDD